MLNPTTPFLIRARDGAQTELWVKYDFGEEEVRAFLVLPPPPSSLFKSYGCFAHWATHTHAIDAEPG